jgi:Flp pilus assembly protein TadD
MDDAEQAFRKLIALGPRDSVGYRELARLYLKTRKDLREARQLAEKAVALEPVAANYFVLAWACDENGDTASARPAIKRAVELEPNDQQYQRLFRVIQQRN